MQRCRICHQSTDGHHYIIKEQYFGTLEEFEYTQCPVCHCLQIVEIPSNLGKHYPDNYYSKKASRQYKNNQLLSFLRSVRLNAALSNSPLCSFFPKPHLEKWAFAANLDNQSRILDVGCGSGQRLLTLRKKGFRDLEGVEPFIEEDILYSNGVRIHRKDLIEFAESVDAAEPFHLIMMHHSLEHMPEQHAVLAAAHKLLRPGGKLLIRTPLCSSYAWEHYRENWVQLDAPRHLYLHSFDSLQRLAGQHGFSLDSYYFDSSGFQFTGSERYSRGISLVEHSDDELFSQTELISYREKAETLNLENRGDQAAFIFNKDSSV